MLAKIKAKIEPTIPRPAPGPYGSSDGEGSMANGDMSLQDISEGNSSLASGRSSDGVFAVNGSEEASAVSASTTKETSTSGELRIIMMMRIMLRINMIIVIIIIIMFYY